MHHQTSLCFASIFVLLGANAKDYTGSMGKEIHLKSLLLDDLNICVIKTTSSNMQHIFGSLYWCAKNQILHCLVRDKTNLPKTGRLRGRYCGSIWMREEVLAPFTKTIIMQLSDGYNIHLSILQFNLYVSKHERCSHNNMFFMSLGFNSDTYCGVRIPWTLVIKESLVALHLSLSSIKPYAVKLFYIGFHLNWIHDIHQINKLNMLGYFWSSIEVTKSSYMSHTEIIQYMYYLITNPSRYFEIRISYVDLSNSDVTVYDGPGRMSNVLFDNHDPSNFQNAMVKSSANCIFLRIQQFNFTTFRIHTKNANMKISNCQETFRHGIITIKSSNYLNIACLYAFDIYLKLTIQSFQFSGPNMMTDLSQFTCQYGGLNVMFSNGKWFEFCQNVYYLDIYSERKAMYFTFISFSGYSQGHIRAAIIPKFCPAIYAELLKPGSVLKFDFKTECTRFICSPSINDMTKCVIKLGPPPLGTTEISLGQLKTLSLCDPQYTDIKPNERMTARMRSVNFPNWPFDLNRTIIHTWTNFTDSINMKFYHLHNASLMLPSFCKNSRRQMGVVVAISACTDNQHGQHASIAVKHIPVLSEDCTGVVHNFKPVEINKVGSGRYHDFLYKDSGGVNREHIVLVTYKTCPAECRNYKYSTFVRNIDGRTVLETTSYVGDFSATGDYHRGFRVSMLIPNKTCEKHHECILSIHMSKTEVKDEISARNNSERVIINPNK